MRKEIYEILLYFWLGLAVLLLTAPAGCSRVLIAPLVSEQEIDTQWPILVGLVVAAILLNRLIR